MFVTLTIQHEKCMRRLVICDLTGSTNFFHIIRGWFKYKPTSAFNFFTKTYFYKIKKISLIYIVSTFLNAFLPEDWEFF